MKIITWNVNGLRAALNKDLIPTLSFLDADIYCFQEIKTTEPPDQLIKFSDEHAYSIISNPAKRKGYAGTLVLTRPKPKKTILGLGEDRFDDEGRTITLKYKDFTLVNSYFPHARHDLSRLPFKLEYNNLFLNHVNRLRPKVILCGDFNVAHREIDIARPKQNEGNAGFTKEERQFIDKLISEGFTDVFRWKHPDEVKYSWWSYRFHARDKNIGWRIDYFFVDPPLLPKVKSCDILTQVRGSDHAPVLLEIRP